jgi:3-oxoacyl-[acyl-carrier protein] reductase
MPVSGSAKRAVSAAMLMSHNSASSRPLLALTDISATRLAETEDALDAFGLIDVMVNLVGGIRSPRLYTPFPEGEPAQSRATVGPN